jgi:hypothetical protein
MSCHFWFDMFSAAWLIFGGLFCKFGSNCTLWQRMRNILPVVQFCIFMVHDYNVFYEIEWIRH